MSGGTDTYRGREGSTLGPPDGRLDSDFGVFARESGPDGTEAGSYADSHASHDDRRPTRDQDHDRQVDPVVHDLTARHDRPDASGAPRYAGLVLLDHYHPWLVHLMAIPFRYGE